MRAFRTQQLFRLGKRKKARKDFFSEEKKQKTFVFWRVAAWHRACPFIGMRHAVFTKKNI